MKFIIFDMDDTLLTDKKEVSPYTLEVLKKLQLMGHKVVINTARSKFYNQEYFDLIKPDYAILNGGALIINGKEEVLFEAMIDEALIPLMIKDLNQIAKTFTFQTSLNVYSSDPNYKNQGAIYFDFINNPFPYHDLLKIVASIPLKEDRIKFAKKYDLEYIDYFGGTFARFNNKAATKALGNKNLLKICNQKLEDTLVFGDDWGDLEMINEAGCGVLMKNSKDEVKKEVKVISKYTNNEDGVARFLAEYFNI